MFLENIDSVSDPQLGGIYFILVLFPRRAEIWFDDVDEFLLDRPKKNLVTVTSQEKPADDSSEETTTAPSQPKNNSLVKPQSFEG